MTKSREVAPRTGFVRIGKATPSSLEELRIKATVTAAVLLALIIALQVTMKGREFGINPFFVTGAKATPLMKYISSERAHDLLARDPNILFIDVRDPIEIAQSGFPSPVDAIVPIKLQTSKFDTNLGEYSLRENPSFISSMKHVLDLHGKSLHDMIIITCGSGRRSAEAVRALVSAGYTNVWHIPDGYAGDEKPGLNRRNAWQMAGLPWSHESIAGSEWIKLLDE